MKIINSTELMKNQKHAVLMAPDKQFEVLQSQEGNALFFSIGTDGIFYLTREAPLGTHGWSRIDLSTAISALNNNAPIIAKTFDVAQDIIGATTDIVLVVTIAGVDSVYTCMGNVNTDDNWSTVATNGVTWTLAGFDSGSDNAATLNVADINFCQSGQLQFIQADIIQNGSNAGDYVNRYFVDPTQVQTGNFWNHVNLPSAMSAGDIHNEVGYLYVVGTPCTYTLSGLKTLNSTEMELTLLPFWNAFDATLDPTHISFILPANTTAIAASQAIGTGSVSDGTPDDTNLFVAAGSSLYFVPNTKQTLGDVPSGIIYTHTNLAGIQSVHTNSTASKTVVWGLNEQGDIFYMSCPAGSEATGTAWSVPVVICSGVEGVATYVNATQNSLVIFAHMSDDSMEQLTQDPTTSHWAVRDIQLPATDPMDMVENYTFTTHIQLTDDNNMPLLSQAITITANTACSLYLNEVYHVLYPAVPLTFTCDCSGVITMIQSIDTLAGVCFNLTYDTQTVNVNPMANVLSYLSSQSGTSGPNLSINVSDEMGTSTPLVSSSVSDNDKTQMALYIAQFIQAQADVSATGFPAATAVSVAYDAKATPDKVFGVYVKDGKLVYYEGVENAANIRTMMRANRVAKPGLLGDDGDNTTEILAGDGWRWLKHKAEEVVQWEIQKFGAINHFIFTIAETEYHFALTAMHDIANGIHFVLNKIQVAFEDMVKWLGSLFAWKDILTTHAVLKEYFLKYMRHSIDNIAGLQTTIGTLADTIKANINQITGLPADSCSTSAASNTNDGGQNKPSSNWGAHHTKANAANGQCNHQTTDPTSLMTILLNAVETEGDTITAAMLQLDGVFSQIGTLAAADIMEKVLGILADALVTSAQNVIDALLQVAADVLTDIVDTLDAPIYIPVISPVYKMFAHADLSIMDLACLITAIPVTVMYKLANNNTAPFSSDDVNTFANAADFTAIAALCFDEVSQAPLQNALVGRDSPPQLTTNKLYDVLEFSGNISCAGGALILSLISTLKTGFPKLANNKILATFNAAFYLPYVAPDILGQAVVIMQKENAWYDVMNTVLSSIGCIKAGIDLKMTCSAAPAPPVAAAFSYAANKPAFVRVKSKPVLALQGVLVGADDDDGDNLQPPPPNPNDVPPPNPDGPEPDPEAPEPNDIPEDGPPPPQNAWANISYDQGPTPTQKFVVPEEKTSWEFISPVFDSVLNAVWNIPLGFVYANSEKKTNDILGLVGNLLFNVSGMIAPICSWGQGPVKWTGIIIADVCNLGYGAMSAATSLDKQPVDS